MADGPLREYRARRDFTRTSEPSGKSGPKSGKGGLRYLVQKHAATRLHFDFRLELDGVLKSWAVTRGPSLNPADKRLAVHVEDHPLGYGDFEGTIPEGEYGGGTVMLWDEGTWEPLEDAGEGLEAGKLKFRLHGKRLKGGWTLVRMRNDRDAGARRSKRENWLLIKEQDEAARAEKRPLIARLVRSVRSDRTMDEIAKGDLEWTRKGAHGKAAVPAPGPKEPKPERRKGPAAKMPAFVAPQLCTLVDATPEGDDWIHEIKYDGYRIETAIADGKVKLYTRKGLDWTGKFAAVVPAFAALPCPSALIDGEIAIADAKGRTDFGALQQAIGGDQTGMAYYAFDLLHLDGEDLRKKPLIERKEALQALLSKLPKASPIVYSDHVVGQGDGVFSNACRLELEGVISKRADAPYRSERTKGWLKVKCGMRQEFVIIGWRSSDVKGRPFSSILLGLHEGGELTYRGRVGSGFGEAEIELLWPQMKQRAIDAPPVADIPREIRRDAHYVKPELIAEIAFRGWTKDGVVRQGSYKGLRQDKTAREMKVEVPAETAKLVGRPKRKTR
jgi:bifunctional non-homologous end joining protein LigD